MAPITSMLSHLTPRGRLALGGVLLVTLVVPFLLMKVAAKPSYTMFMAGIEPAQTGRITAALDQHGVAYELRSNGTALAVDPSQTAQARIALAEQGLGAGGTAQPGFELFDKHKLGTSDFQQKVDYERALEGEIARTVGGIAGVGGAQVQLVLPDEQLFTDEAQPATAAVLLSGDGSALDPASVRGMARLVSSSVEGLQPEQVTITDGSGQLLWPGADGGAFGGGSKAAAERRYEQELGARLDALLTQTVGPGKARVQANVDLNVDESTQSRLVYDRRGVPLRDSTEQEQLAGGGGGAAAGAAGNVPSYAAGTGGGAGSTYRNRKRQTDYALNKTVTRTKIAPGSVNRLDVALLVDESVEGASVTALRQAVASAAGIDAKRGDRLSLSRVAFAKAPEAPAAEAAAGPLPAGAIGMAKYAVLGLGTLIFGFLVMRHLRRREREELADARWMREISTPTPLAAIEAEAQARAALSIAPTVRNELEELATSEPERVAQQVRNWMGDG